ncbi:basic proline-rich protein-like [Haliaeetus albicilla]|uniref:basic proline-rich protein-like n=1 Tax=Haliaeetus albicilla TaxID=8969 RepID=UPI0037E729CB
MRVPSQAGKGRQGSPPPGRRAGSGPEPPAQRPGAERRTTSPGCAAPGGRPPGTAAGGRAPTRPSLGRGRRRRKEPARGGEGGEEESTGCSPAPHLRPGGAEGDASQRPAAPAAAGASPRPPPLPPRPRPAPRPSPPPARPLPLPRRVFGKAAYRRPPRPPSARRRRARPRSSPTTGGPPGRGPRSTPGARVSPAPYLPHAAGQQRAALAGAAPGRAGPRHGEGPRLCARRSAPLRSARAAPPFTPQPAPPWGQAPAPCACLPLRSRPSLGSRARVAPHGRPGDAILPRAGPGGGAARRGGCRGAEGSFPAPLASRRPAVRPPVPAGRPAGAAGRAGNGIRDAPRTESQGGLPRRSRSPGPSSDRPGLKPGRTLCAAARRSGPAVFSPNGRRQLLL